MDPPKYELQNGNLKADGKKIAEQKRHKYLLKQQKKTEQEQSQKEEDEWFQRYSKFVTRINLTDAKNIKIISERGSPARNKSRKRPRDDNAPLPSTDEERKAEMDPSVLSKLEYIQPYMDLKESSDAKNFQIGEMGSYSANSTRYFIAEGTETVRMLIEQSTAGVNANDKSDDADRTRQIKIHSIFIKPAPLLEEPVNLRNTLSKSYPNVFDEIEHDCSTRTSTAPNFSTHNQLPFQVIVGSEKAMTEIVGFPVARGAMACGIVPHYDETWLINHLRQKQLHDSSDSSSIRILALENVNDTANLGSLIRTSAAFGIHAIILSDDSCDVWYRRCVRVSMGHVLSVPSIRVPNLSSTLSSLKREFNVVSYAAVIDRDADMVLERTEPGGICKNWCCVLGNEGNGLTKQMSNYCDHKIRIQMDGVIDSLSVGVAGGILLHGMKEREAK